MMFECDSGYEFFVIEVVFEWFYFSMLFYVRL